MKFNRQGPMALLAVSLAFTVCGYGILYASAASVLQPIVSVWRMMATDTPRTEDDGSYVDLFGSANTEELPVGDTVNSSDIRFPLAGTKYGEISVAGTEVNCPLFFGDDTATLRRGAGKYVGSSFPGFGSTVLVGGHNNSFFRGLKDAEVGALVTVKTHYGEYVYRITETAIKKHTDRTAYDLAATTENLVLYTCYPFGELGLTTDRYFVYAELVSGPAVLTDR